MRTQEWAQGGHTGGGCWEFRPATYNLRRECAPRPVDRAAVGGRCYAGGCGPRPPRTPAPVLVSDFVRFTCPVHCQAVFTAHTLKTNSTAQLKRTRTRNEGREGKRVKWRWGSPSPPILAFPLANDTTKMCQKHPSKAARREKRTKLLVDEG